MPTHKEIQDHVRRTRNYLPKSCWIAVKAAHGLTARQAPSRTNPNSRMHPCPPDK